MNPGGHVNQSQTERRRRRRRKKLVSFVCLLPNNLPLQRTNGRKNLFFIVACNKYAFVDLRLVLVSGSTLNHHLPCTSTATRKFSSTFIGCQMRNRIVMWNDMHSEVAGQPLLFGSFANGSNRTTAVDFKSNLPYARFTLLRFELRAFFAILCFSFNADEHMTPVRSLAKLYETAAGDCNVDSEWHFFTLCFRILN